VEFGLFDRVAVTAKVLLFSNVVVDALSDKSQQTKPKVKKK
jgi:hypothetical protein